MRRLTRYRDRVALVTGASSGIGRLLALRLAEKGARLALVARREGLLEELASEIRRRSGEVLVAPCDVGEAEQVDTACRRVLERFGRVDLLINNAGYGRHRPFLEWDLEDMERMCRVNYVGALRFTRRLLPDMARRGEGWVVFVASVAGRIAVPYESAYVATKFALVGLAESISLEVEEQGVHVLTVCPGVIRTPFFDDEALRRMPPVARRSMVEPDGLVSAILGALAAGRRSLTYPRRLALAYKVGGVAPGFLRRQVRRHTRPAPGGTERKS